MSSTYFNQSTSATESTEMHPYRTMSRMAMLSMIFGLLSALGLLAPALVGFSILGGICCLLALRTIARHPDEYSGRTAALVGGALSLALMLAATSYHTYVYYTEVPDGYQRISFRVLQPTKGSTQLVPQEAANLDGKAVFVGGYMHPDAGLEPVQSFVLVPDMGTCCFGGQPELTDMIEVTLKGNDRVRYSTRKRKFAGKLHVDWKPREELQGTFYQLDVDAVVR